VYLPGESSVEAESDITYLLLFEFEMP